jgi:hypothetical protein
VAILFCFVSKHVKKGNRVINRQPKKTYHVTTRLYFIGMQCENGKVYQGCGGPAPQTCENIGPGRPTFWNNVQTNEGCFCPDGQISDGQF